MLKKLYEKSKLWFSLGWIIAYVVLMSAGDSLSLALGVEKSATLAVGLVLSVILFCFLKKYCLLPYYGICKAKASPRAMLYYLPVLILLSANLWYGISPSLGILEAVLYVLSMLCVGFLEEVIFRGLLFDAIGGESSKTAVFVSSITFGAGHIVNLVNGSGAELLPNILQVIYATAAGFMFVMMYVCSKSLISCIVAHGVFNSLSVLAPEAPSYEARIMSCILITAISVSYAVYLVFQSRRSQAKKADKEVS